MNDMVWMLLGLLGCLLGAALGSAMSRDVHYARGHADGRCDALCQVEGHDGGSADPDPDGMCACLTVAPLEGE